MSFFGRFRPYPQYFSLLRERRRLTIGKTIGKWSKRIQMNEWHELERTRKTIAFGIKNCSYKVGTHIHIYKWICIWVKTYTHLRRRMQG